MMPTQDQTAAAPPPSAIMMQLIGGFQVSQAVYVVVDTGLATILEQEGPKSITELADRTGTSPGPLGRLVRTLAPLGLFSTDGDEVTLTEVGSLLSERHPQSLANLTRMWMQTHYLPFSELGHSVRHGTPGADAYLGESFFDWIARDDSREQLFSRAMADITGNLRAGLFDDYRLPAGRVVADLGGSDGSLLVELFAHDDDPDRRGILFDQPTTTPTAEPVLRAAGLQDRVDVVSGDFFSAVPAADIYLLSYIFHDWNDDENRTILASIRAAAAPGARVLVVEGVVPPGDGPHLTKAIDLTMLGMLTGQERSEAHYRELLEGAGFALDRVVATSTPFSILEATLR